MHDIDELDEQGYDIEGSDHYDYSGGDDLVGEPPVVKDVDGTLIYQAQAGMVLSEMTNDEEPVVGASIFYGGTVFVGDTVGVWEHLWQQVTREITPPPVFRPATHDSMLVPVDDTSQF
jgi:hypothetical protein